MNQFFLTTASKFSLAVAITALTFVLSPSAQGDEFDRIDRLAQKIQKKSQLLIKETDDYRRTPQYAALVDSATHLYDAAGHVHKVAHFANNLNHLQSDLANLDLYFQQLESLFEAAKDSVSRGRGHIHGGTGYAKGLLRSIEVSIDSMRRDVRKLQSKHVSRPHEVYRTPVAATRHDHVGYGHDRRRGQVVVPPRPVPHRAAQPIVTPARVVPHYRPAYPQHRRAGGFSLSIGGGSSRIHLNF